MVWSLTPFHNELDILEIRLRTLDEVVDRHVIAEATVTQVGTPKPLYFAESGSRFDIWRKKIVHVVVEDMPAGAGEQSDWGREHHQRDCLMRGLDAAPGDVILSSDVDEIPYPNQIDLGNAREARMILAQHVYALNWRWKSFHGARAQILRPRDLDTQSLSEWSDWPEIIAGGWRGWHFSYMGGVEMIQTKIQSIADDFRGSKYSSAMTDTHIRRCIAFGADIYGRKHNCDWVGLDQLPECCSDPKFAHLLVDNPCVLQ
jgi:beta-1,4-mannosyl-glycoprotein beta-1,4-N-acetylglucosaminyltransferase